jgi:hypothetical protein
MSWARQWALACSAVVAFAGMGALLMLAAGMPVRAVAPVAAGVVCGAFAVAAIAALRGGDAVRFHRRAGLFMVGAGGVHVGLAPATLVREQFRSWSVAGHVFSALVCLGLGAAQLRLAARLAGRR